MAAYFSKLTLVSLLNACPGGVASGLIWGIMALGVYLTFRVLDLADLTVDGSFATGGAVCIMMVLGGVNPQLALIVSFLAGVVAGIITGVLHTTLGIPAILAGILTQISLYSINLNIMGKANQAVNVNQVSFYFTSNAKVLGRTILLVAVVAAVVIAALYWYLGTEQGSAIRATGTNPNMSRAQGINTEGMKIIGLALSNGLVALSGGILSQYQGFADVNMGRGAIVIGLAAVIIGEVLGSLFGKRLNFALRLMFVVLGGVAYYIVYVFVLWLKFPADDMKLLTAIVVAAFLAVPYLKSKSASSFARAAKVSEAAIADYKKEDDHNA
ncbi:MAG: ABC transporter permease [Oscillospiraceae bacterium]|nr:ABC transporter permease [Oscillospiraceae bacterium]